MFTLDDDRSGTLLERAAQCSDTHEPAPRGADDLAAILYTSGTTGRSKGAMLTHGNLLSNARVLQELLGLAPGDVLIHALPIFHVHGLFVASHGALLNGSKMIWLAKFDPKAVDRAPAARHRLHGRADAVRAPARRARADAPRPARTCGCSSPARRRCCSKPSSTGASAAATRSSSATA